MAAPIVATQAIVLKISPSGETFQQANILSSEMGVLTCMLRRKQSKGAAPIDLFDQGEFHIELKEGSRSGFLKEFTLSTNRPGIGSSYEILTAAARFSKFLLSNPISEENANEIFELAEKTFNALDAKHPPNSVLLKTLFLYCRDEGYPVQEDWAHNLESEIKAIAVSIINTPLANINRTAQEQSVALESLITYMRDNSDIRFA